MPSLGHIDETFPIRKTCNQREMLGTRREQRVWTLRHKSVERRNSQVEMLSLSILSNIPYWLAPEAYRPFVKEAQK